MRSRILLIGIAAIPFIGAFVLSGCFRETGADEDRGSQKKAAPAPVEVSPILRQQIERRRTFSGTVEAGAQFVVAPKVSGRIVSLFVDISDEVSRGAVVARLDNDEFRHVVAQAEANLAVVNANVLQALAGLQIAEREHERVRALVDREIATQSELDTAEAERATQDAAVQVEQAQVLRAKAQLASAETRLDYTEITATWSDGEDGRIVAQRFVDVGDTVAANTPLFSIVKIDPVKTIITVTEGDYPHLKPGQRVEVTTDALGEKTFVGRISRIAPVFQERSRQARVELQLPNPDSLLKPGMFARAEVVLETVDDGIVVPEAAVVTRNGTTGVFVLVEKKSTVLWKEVVIGIQQGGFTQIKGVELSGRVVTLGHQLIDSESPVTVLESPGATPR